MTRGRALRVLFISWLTFAAAPSVLITLQSMNGRYGADSSIAWSWLSGAMVPILSLVVTATFVEHSPRWLSGQAGRFRFITAMALSGLYSISVLAVLLVQPLLSYTPFDLFRMTELPLALWQGVTLASVATVIFDNR